MARVALDTAFELLLLLLTSQISSTLSELLALPYKACSWADATLALKTLVFQAEWYLQSQIGKL